MRYTRVIQRRTDTYGLLTEEKPPVLERYQNQKIRKQNDSKQFSGSDYKSFTG
ncbi:hypothetical protein [Eisenbergiella sp.]|uniref:hypothetical protein n=1 Tax=Eisenbergiella sp. TaxID=1924109 RepID=UPI00208B1935|nr:hypothetical protein [Eisenbergiella sp.]BDF47825.1 hypothetical protein CE91St56_49480 [Lachnospiraceae bacterium]GKH43900.1 hypothetical protein CE91St57_48740 [Lachnospiraceae bacterium]